MIEINSSVHDTLRRAARRAARRRAMRSPAHARQMNVAIAGGGTHPFQKWSERKIYPTERFLSVSEKYGFLAKQFTVFGQHIHIGCASADDAIYLTSRARSATCRTSSRSAASSPFYQGVDTAFDSSRLSVVNAFPLSGTMPYVPDWAAFNRYFDTMYELGIVKSMKDFYWDVRPEARVRHGRDPRVRHAAHRRPRRADRRLCAGARAPAVVATRVDWITPDLYLVHSYNRFQACRHGLEGTLIDPATRQLGIARRRHPRARCASSPARVGAGFARPRSKRCRRHGGERRTTRAWLREAYAATKTLPDVVRAQAARWMNR